MIILKVLLIVLTLLSIKPCDKEWWITAYCECKKCCGKEKSNPDYGVMASGKRVYVGAVACNVLPFKTKVCIEGLGIYTVEDRGSRRLFDNKKHIDIYIPSHKKALEFGVQYRKVKVFNDSTRRKERSN